MTIPIQAVDIDGVPVITNVISGDPRIQGDSVIRVSPKDHKNVVRGLSKLSKHFSDLIRKQDPEFGR